MEPLKALFFEHTLRHWHFEELVRASGMSRERVNHYLKELHKEHFLGHVKPRGKRPYFIARAEKADFRIQKRLYGLHLLERSGLFAHLLSLNDLKTAILFGSFSRGDWGSSSDVDLFLYGDDSLFERGAFESRLGRPLQVFSFGQAQEAKRLEPAVLRNIAQGFTIKGNLEPLQVKIHA